MTLPRTLSPNTNPAGLLAAAGAVYAAAVVIYNAFNHHGVFQPEVIVAAIGAVGALFTRQLVTPVKDPKDGNGTALVPALGPVPPGGTGTVAPVGKTEGPSKETA